MYLGVVNKPTLVIGDVHGCLHELQDLILEASLAVDFQPLKVISVGDLIDKGPDSIGVLKQMNSLKLEPFVVQGNHETKALRDGIAKDSTGEVDLGLQLTTLNPRPWVLFDHIVDGVSKPYLCVHGGLYPSLLKKGQELAEILPLMEPLMPKWWKLTTMVRRINPETGGFVSLDQEKPEYPYWWELYGKGHFLALSDGQPVTVLHGHHPMPWVNGSPTRTEYTVNLDTGCVFGGWLTGMLFLPDRESQLLRVQAGERYAEPYTSFPVNEFIQREIDVRESEQEDIK